MTESDKKAAFAAWKSAALRFGIKLTADDQERLYDETFQPQSVPEQTKPGRVPRQPLCEHCRANVAEAIKRGWQAGYKRGLRAKEKP